MSEQKHAIIYISIDLVSGLTKMKNIVNELRSIGELRASSTVYKKFRSRRAEDLNASIVMATRWSLRASEAEVFEEIARIMDYHLSQNSWSGNLEIMFLAATNTVRLVPEENLPHPQLHMDSLILRCAAEVYGEYHHPILDQTLAELVLCSDPVRDAEFFDQGREIV